MGAVKTLLSPGRHDNSRAELGKGSGQGPCRLSWSARPTSVDFGQKVSSRVAIRPKFARRGGSGAGSVPGGRVVSELADPGGQVLVDDVGQADGLEDLALGGS